MLWINIVGTDFDGDNRHHALMTSDPNTPEISQGIACFHRAIFMVYLDRNLAIGVSLLCQVQSRSP